MPEVRSLRSQGALEAPWAHVEAGGGLFQRAQPARLNTTSIASLGSSRCSEDRRVQTASNIASGERSSPLRRPPAAVMMLVWLSTNDTQNDGRDHRGT